MPDLTPVLRSFVGGEISPEMLARTDDPRVQNGAKRLRNYIVRPQGPAQRRPGLEFVAKQKAKAKLLPFKLSSNEAIVVEQGAGYFRFHFRGEPLYHVEGLRIAAVDDVANRITFLFGHGLVFDQQVRIVEMTAGNLPGGLNETDTFFVRVVDARTIELAATAGGAAINLVGTGLIGSMFLFAQANMPTYTDPASPSSYDVSAGNEFINFAAAHNLQTGDPVVFVGSEVASALGLNVLQEYFAIRINNTVIAVASSLANALAGTKIDLAAAPGTLANVRMRRNYKDGDIVFFDGAGRGFFYCKAAPSLDSNPAIDNQPPAAAFWHRMPDDGQFEIANRIHTAGDELFEIKREQRFNILTLTHKNRPITKLRRFSAKTWTVDTLTFSPPLNPPGNFGVTTVERGIEIGVASVTALTPAEVTTSRPHQLAAGDSVFAVGTIGTIVTNRFLIVSSTPAINKVILSAVGNGAELGSSNTTVSAALLRPCSLSATLSNEYRITSMTADGRESAPSNIVTFSNVLAVPGASNLLTWDPVAGASRYRLYKRKGSLFGFLAETELTSFKDDNVDADLKITLPQQDTSLSGTDYPGAVGRFDQRQIFAATKLFPFDAWMSKPAADGDLSFSIPIVDTDRIRFQLDTDELAEIRHVVGTLRHLALLASDGEYQVTPLNSDVITPDSIAAPRRSGVGSSHVRPVLVGTNLIFNGDRDNHIYEFGFQQSADGFKPGDLAIRSAHLFDGLRTTDAAYAKAPYPLLFWPQSDGTLPCLTYVPEEGVGPWSVIETKGVIESVCVVPEDNEDRLYASVLRVVNGVEVRHLERMQSLQGRKLLEDNFFVDAGVTFNGRNTSDLLQITVSGGRRWGPGETLTITANGPLFRSADVGDEVVLPPNGDPSLRVRLAIRAFVSATVVQATVDRTIPLAFQNAATTAWGIARRVINGLDHLEGESVQILAEGKVLPIQTVAAGRVTLPSPHVLAHIGIGCTATLHTLPLILPIEGFGKGRTINASRAAVQLQESAPFKMGPSDEAKDLVTVGERELAAGGTLEVAAVLKGKWTPGGEVVIVQDDPLPLTIVGLALDAVVGGD